MRAVAIAAAVVVAGARVAHADCAGSEAACTLQAEGTELLVSGQFARAEERFRASIAAEPSARAYLGYAQAVEGLGKLGLAYDSLLVAKELSARELAADPNSVDSASRGERIAYKLAELAPRVGFVRLQLPPWTTNDPVLEVVRLDEGPVGEPMTREFAVTPGRRLGVMLRSGARAVAIASVAPGGHAVIAVPMPFPPGPLAVPAAEERTTFAPLPALAIAVDAIATTGGANVGFGVGGAVRLERRLAPWLAGGAAVAAMFHPATHQDAIDVDFAARGFGAWLLVRTAPRSRFYAAASAGVLSYTRTATAPASDAMPALEEDLHGTYAALGLGAGMRVGRVELGLTLLGTPGLDAALSIPPRLLLSVGFAAVQR